MNRATSAPKIAHYYGRLKVATDAPPEVIRAAYKALVQKCHPDRHQGSLRHELLVTALNKAQEVLLDPARRAAHDQWIRQEEIRLGLREPSDASALGFGLRLRLFWTSISIDGLPFAAAWRAPHGRATSRFRPGGVRRAGRAGDDDRGPVAQ